MVTNLATLYNNKPPIICKEQIDNKKSLEAQAQYFMNK